MASIYPILSPNTEFIGQKMFQITTIYREFSALINLPMIPLVSEVLNPAIIRVYKPENRVILDTQKRLKVNRPQALAIATAVGQKYGF
ncbi:hypothetical protein HK096_000290, partial [Nowakowskiella sp. JEL0078]